MDYAMKQLRQTQQCYIKLINMTFGSLLSSTEVPMFWVLLGLDLSVTWQAFHKCLFCVFNH